MKMPSSRRTNHRSRNALLTPGTLLVGVLALFIFILAILRFAAPGAFVAIASPFWGAGTSLSGVVDYMTKGFKNSATVANERDQVVTQNNVLEAQNRTLEAQVHDLEQLLGNRTEAPAGILASVRARPPVAPYDVLIVDQGTASNVMRGATAYGPGGTPVGTVASVSGHSARITLYSNPGLETEAWAGDTRVPVTLRGTGSGGFEATLPKAAGITEGQGVYVAGSGALPVGTVARIDRDPSSPNVILHIRPYVNPFSLTWVTISRESL